MTEANEALLRRYIELYNDRAWDRLAELLTDDYVHHSNAEQTIEELRKLAPAAMAGDASG